MEAPEPSQNQGEEVDLKQLVENRPEKERLKSAWGYVLGLFYTVFCGIVIGMLINQAADRGVWGQLFGSNEVPEVPVPKPAENREELFGEKGNVFAFIAPLSAHAEHSKAVEAQHLSAMGLDPKTHRLFALEMIVRKDKEEGEVKSLVLNSDRAWVKLQLKDKEVSSIALPTKASNPVINLLLQQKRPSGEILAGASRQLWVAFEGSFEFSEIKGATIAMVGQEALTLTPTTE